VTKELKYEKKKMDDGSEKAPGPILNQYEKKGGFSEFGKMNLRTVQKEPMLGHRLSTNRVRLQVGSDDTQTNLFRIGFFAKTAHTLRTEDWLMLCN
jgi:hypothetical protein